MPLILFELFMLMAYKNDPPGSNNDLQNYLFVQRILMSLLRCYPLLDPLIYAARIPPVQQ